MANIEYRALLQCAHGLTDLLQHNLSVSDKLLEKGWITRDVHGWALTVRGVSDQEKASRLVSCLAARVKDAAQVFHDFVDVLKEDPFFTDIVEKINAEYKTILDLEKPCDGGRDENVGKRIKMLERQFSSMRGKLLSELTARSDMSPDMLVDSLTQLPVALRAEYHKFVFDHLDTLESADSIRKIFRHINLHFTFVDHGLMGHLIEEFGSDQLQRDMSAYAVKMQSFLSQTTVLQLMDHWPGQRDIPPHFEELRAVIDRDPKTYTLRELDDLRKRVCSETKLSETILVLIGVGRKNSFIVYWVVPSIFVFRLKSPISSLRSFYEREHIFSVAVGRQRLYSIAAEYEERLFVLCYIGGGDVREFQDLLSQPELETNIYDKDGRTPLWYLSYYGRTELVQLLLQHGAEVDLPIDNEYGDTALIPACGEGRVMVATVLIKKGALVNYQNKKGTHPLSAASSKGRLECVELLLNHNAQIDLPKDDDLGSTALGTASQEGRVDVARLLIERGAAIDYQNKRGETALFIATWKGHTAVVRLLLIHGAKTDIQDINGYHPLYKASFYGNLECVELLLDRGAQIDLPVDDDLGFTALVAASQEGHVDVAQLLIERGAAIDYQSKQGASPLYMASQNDHDDVVQLLLDGGARIDLPAKIGKKNVVCGQSDVVQDSSTKKFVHTTPLLAACVEGRTHTASLLIEAGANINYKDEDGWTPLIASSTTNHRDTVELLIEKKAQLDIQTKEGWTALSLASWMGCAEIVQILVIAGIHINIKGQAELTALMLATQRSHARIVQILLDGKADPNITDETSGWTAIYFAIQNNNLEIIEILIKGGARLGIKDNNGLTAFEVAKAYNQQAICDLLENYRSKEEIMQEDSESSVEEPGHSAQAPPQLPPLSPQAPATPLPEELDFVNSPSEDFFCPVTFELLVDPHLTACCGNHLSQRAVTRLKSEGKPCPICKEPDLATMLDKFHRRKVRAVQVRCPHTPGGCEWAGEVGELSQHIQTCLKQHTESC